MYWFAKLGVCKVPQVSGEWKVTNYLLPSLAALDVCGLGVEARLVDFREEALEDDILDNEALGDLEVLAPALGLRDLDLWPPNDKLGDLDLRSLVLRSSEFKFSSSEKFGRVALGSSTGISVLGSWSWAVWKEMLFWGHTNWFCQMWSGNCFKDKSIWFCLKLMGL